MDTHCSLRNVCPSNMNTIARHTTTTVMGKYTTFHINWMLLVCNAYYLGPLRRIFITLSEHIYICKIRRMHMTNTWYASGWDQAYRPSYAKIRHTVVCHIQVHLYFICLMLTSYPGDSEYASILWTFSLCACFVSSTIKMDHNVTLSS